MEESGLPDVPVASNSNGAPTPLTILDVLARQVQRSLPIWDLQSLSGMDANRFRDALKNLRALDYVVVDGASLEEVIRLTDKGAEAASLAR
jgi:DNA-binding IclR family transcriptional regulator